MRATPIYAALLALMFVVLSARTIGLRRRLRVAVGDGGDKGLERAMRVHANFAEYVPLALLLIYFLEMHTRFLTLVHGLCIALIAGRLLHAYGVSQVQEKFIFRQVGMALTFGVIITAAITLLVVGTLAATL